MTTEIIDAVEAMLPYSKTSFLNLSVCGVTDIANALLNRILIDNPDIKKAIVKIKDYNIIIKKDDTKQA